jgi:hypothetical protein
MIKIQLYIRGETVEVEFVGGHLKKSYLIRKWFSLCAKIGK